MTDKKPLGVYTVIGSIRHITPFRPFRSCWWQEGAGVMVPVGYIQVSNDDYHLHMAAKADRELRLIRTMMWVFCGISAVALGVNIAYGLGLL